MITKVEWIQIINQDREVRGITASKSVVRGIDVQSSMVLGKYKIVSTIHYTRPYSKYPSQYKKWRREHLIQADVLDKNGAMVDYHKVSRGKWKIIYRTVDNWVKTENIQLF